MDKKSLLRNILGFWIQVNKHDFPESLKFHNFTKFSHSLGHKDYRKSKFSKIFDHLALPNRDWNLCTMAI